MEQQETCPHGDMHCCPLYIASHAGAGCFVGGGVAQPCRVRRGEIGYDQAYDDAVSAARSDRNAR